MEVGEGSCNKCNKELRWRDWDNKPYGSITFQDYSRNDYDGKEFLFCEKCFTEILMLSLTCLNNKQR
jgi:hypothetical protein